MKSFEEAGISPEKIQEIETAITRRVDGRDVQDFLKGLLRLAVLGSSEAFARAEIVAVVDPDREQFTSNFWAGEKKLKRQFETHRAYLSEGLNGLLLDMRCDESRRPYRYQMGLIERADPEVPFQLEGSVLRYRASEVAPRLSLSGRLTHPGVGADRQHYRKWVFLLPLFMRLAALAFCGVMIALALYLSSKGAEFRPVVYAFFIGLAVLTWWSVSRRWERLFDDRILLLGMSDVAGGDRGVVLDRAEAQGAAAHVIRRYVADCPICDAATIVLARGEPDFPRRIVGRCDNSPREHVFSFDRVTLEGAPLRSKRKVG